MLIKSRKLPSDGSLTLRSFIHNAKRHRISYHAGCPLQSKNGTYVPATAHLEQSGEIYYEYELDVTRDSLFELLRGDEALDELIPPATDEFFPSHRAFSVVLDWAEGLGVDIIFKS